MEHCFKSSPKDLLIDFRETGRGRGEREKNKCETEVSFGCLPYAPWLGIKSQLFGDQDITPTDWATGPGPHEAFLNQIIDGEIIAVIKYLLSE